MRQRSSDRMARWESVDADYRRVVSSPGGGLGRSLDRRGDATARFPGAGSPIGRVGCRSQLSGAPDVAVNTAFLRHVSI